MEYLSELLTDVAAALKLDRSASAQIVIVLAGTVISLAAAIAAFLSARATAKSVKEMRAARIQGAKAVLEIISNHRIEFVWDRKLKGPEYRLEGKET